MSAPHIDCLPGEGTLSRQIVLNALKGRFPREIARDMNIPRNTVYAALRDARANGIPVPCFSAGRSVIRQAVTSLSPTARSSLTRAAFQRGMEPPELAARLIAVVLNDNLIDAILDDGGDE